MKNHKKMTAKLLVILGLSLSVQDVFSSNVQDVFSSNTERIARGFGDTLKARQEREDIKRGYEASYNQLIESEGREFADMMERERSSRAEALRAQMAREERMAFGSQEAPWIKSVREDMIPMVRQEYAKRRDDDKARIDTFIATLPAFVEKYKGSAIRTHNLPNLLDYYKDEAIAKLAFNMLEKLRSLPMEDKIKVLRSIEKQHYS